MTYDFKEHKHRFAIWTAARAVQRGFATTSLIREAINASGLRKFAESENSITQEEFDSLHKDWCEDLMKTFNTKIITRLGRGAKCSYGRAAKIVAIYLKTSVILPSGGDAERSLLIHPPLDSIIFTSIAKDAEYADLRFKNWTTLDESQYWDIVKLLRNHKLGFNWKIEELWDPVMIKKQYYSKGKNEQLL